VAISTSDTKCAPKAMRLSAVRVAKGADKGGNGGDRAAWPLNQNVNAFTQQMRERNQCVRLAAQGPDRIQETRADTESAHRPDCMSEGKDCAGRSLLGGIVPAGAEIKAIGER
jgi:hypothetical protein